MVKDQHAALNLNVPAHLVAIAIGFVGIASLLYSIGLRFLAAHVAAAGLASVTILWWASPRNPPKINVDRDDTFHVKNPEQYIVGVEDIDVTPDQEQMEAEITEGNASGGDGLGTETEDDTADTEPVRAD